MFQLDKNKAKEPRTKQKCYRLPTYIIKELERLKKASGGISETEIVIQMLSYCMGIKL